MTVQSADQELIQVQVILAAQRFVEKYYKTIDTEDAEKRLRDMIAMYANPGSVIIWNGHTSLSAPSPHDFVKMMLEVMPPTKHTIQNVDALPLPGCVGGDVFIAHVVGSVVYDKDHFRTFYHSFIIRTFEGRTYVMEDDFRWTGEKAEKKKAHMHYGYPPRR